LGVLKALLSRRILLGKMEMAESQDGFVKELQECDCRSGLPTDVPESNIHALWREGARSSA
jgi:hypothetical protein